MIVDKLTGDDTECHARKKNYVMSVMSIKTKFFEKTNKDQKMNIIYLG